jgi:hypothetical protein
MKKFLNNQDLRLSEKQDSKMSSTLELIQEREVEVIEPDDEIRKSNLRDYLETYGYMEDII